MKSPAEIWAATSGKFLGWTLARSAERKAWVEALSVSPNVTFWLGADGDKEAA